MSIHSAPVLKAYQKASIILLCAHRWEAQPFLDELCLQLETSTPFPFPLYSGIENIALAVTGQGLVRSSSSTAALLSHTKATPGPILIANFGLAGAVREEWAIGQRLLINKVSDPHSGSSLFPDRLLRHSWPEAPCLSVARVASLADIAQGGTRSPVTTSPVYDMEAYGICAAGEQYLSTSQILIGKYVSDHLAQTAPVDWREMVDRIASGYSEAALEFLNMARAHQQSLHSDDRREQARNALEWLESTLEGITARLTLTVSQTRTLESRLKVHALAISNKAALETLKHQCWNLLCEVEPESNKEENKRHLARVLNHLLTPSLFEGPHHDT